ncbi:quaternary ammonium compound-resistance protein SugE [Rhodovulum imhoffii]|uniref:Guanidinium exporter n=1 Tax=Rhodovulum imhoffii TaxID=365340 RepID=A0A2T5BRL9_9RHOB|nr:multidrug efflux SMR transporter [Rhodovulum imhoffii]MBK5934045.1 QacE family quaternary ammonium compound efflux SMR transporter [Rhodovulum imhoffii]PTN01930.1 quaternary ammonium compound-resistance protein SugE [Rhodovulum imhoffii]
MGWLILLFAGLFEIGFTTAMKTSDGLTRPLPSLAFLICAVASFFLLFRSLDYLPLGTAYAVWTGIGAVGTVLVGIFLYDEPAGLLRMFFLSLLIASIVGLKFVSSQ